MYRDALTKLCDSDGIAFVSAGDGTLKGEDLYGVDVADCGWSETLNQYEPNQVRSERAVTPPSGHTH